MDNIALEMMIPVYNLFFRRNIVFRANDLTHKQTIIDKNFILPRNSVLHFTDNLSIEDGRIDVPSLTKYSFLDNKIPKKQMYNNKTFPTEGTFALKDKVRFYSPGLQSNLFKFINKNKSIIKPIYSVNDIGEQENILYMINHNPLFRIKTRGILKEYDRFYAFMLSMLNSIDKTVDGKNHFIYIEINSELLKNNFISIVNNKKISQATLRLTNMYYYFVLHLVLFLFDNHDKLSLFSKLPTEKIPFINIMFCNKKKDSKDSIIYNLQYLISLCNNQQKIWRFLSALNTLYFEIDPKENIEIVNKLTEESDITLIKEVVKPITGNVSNSVKKTMEKAISNDTAITKEKSETIIASTATSNKDENKIIYELFKKIKDRYKYEYNWNVDYLELGLSDVCIFETGKINKKQDPNECAGSWTQNKKIYVKPYKDIDKAMDFHKIKLPRDQFLTLIMGHETAHEIYFRYLSQDERDAIYKYIKSIKFTTGYADMFKKEPDYPKELFAEYFGHVMAGLIKGSPDVIKKLNKKSKETTIEDIVDTIDTSKTASKFTLVEEPKEFSKYIDSKVTEFLDRSEILTPAQKAKAIELSKKYKNIPVKINGKVQTIGKVISTPPNYEIEKTTFDVDEKTLIDKSMIKSSIKHYDKQYMDNFFYYDLFQNIVSFQANGLFLSEYSENNESNEINRVKNIRIRFETPERKHHTIKFKIPIPDDDGFFIINGVKTKLSKQLVNTPICKISPTRVSLVSNYNKTIVDRVGNNTNGYFPIIKKALKKKNIDFRFKDNHYTEKFPYDYSALGNKFDYIKGKKGTLYFDRKEIQSSLKLNDATIKKIKKYGTLIGKSTKYKNTYIFITDSNRIRLIDINSETEYEKDENNYINNIIFGDDADQIKVSRETCNLKILDQNIPIAFILSYRLGFSKVLDLLGVKYRTVDIGKSKNLLPNELVIRFKNKYFIYNKYPLKNSLVLNGFLFYPSLKNFDIEEFDSEDVYYQLLLSKGLSINYLKGIANYFDFFVDPITRDVLQQMGEPTNTIQLLIRSVELLTTDDHEEASSTKNLRIRSFERLNSIVYNEISRQYANYVSSKYKEKSFSINTEAIFQRLIQDQTNVLAENINPIHSIKENERITYVGFGGRSNESFVERDRKYPKDGLGIIGEATPDSGNVSINTFLTADPTIKNARGMLDQSGEKNPTNLLSTTSLLMPGATNDDQFLKVLLKSNFQLEFSLIAGNPLELSELQRNQQ